LIALVLVACKARDPDVADAAALALEGFEGEIDLAGDIGYVFGVADSGTHTELKVEIKGDNIRVERDDARWVTIVDATAKKSWTLDTATRTYVADRLGEPAPAAKDAKRTGSANVAGIPCEVWEVDDALGHRTVCLAPGLRKTFMGRAEPTWSSASDDESLFAKGFPLRDVTIAAGQTMRRVEATRVVRRPISDADFVTPAGYVERPPLNLRGL